MKPIFHDCKQGSAAWHALRLGIPTASRFDAIITPTGKPVTGKARTDYIAELVGERLTEREASIYVTAAMERGVALEPRGRAWYQVVTGREVRQVGFITPEKGPRCGYSPDGVCNERIIEIKCNLDTNHVRRLLMDDLSAAEDYYLQCQGGMWIAGVTLCDLILFTDTIGLPNRIITIERNDKIFDALDAHIEGFCNDVDSAEKSLRRMGGGIYMRDQYAELVGDEWQTAPTASLVNLADKLGVK